MNIKRNNSILWGCIKKGLYFSGKKLAVMSYLTHLPTNSCSIQLNSDTPFRTYSVVGYHSRL